MTRIAIISDAHSNIPATEAVFSHIEKNHIDYIYSLGDMIGKGPSPAEVVDLHKNNCDITVLGNWEDFLLHSNVFELPIDFYRTHLTQDHMDFFYSLDYNIEFYLSGYFFRIFHAHPNNVYRRIFKKVPLQSHGELFLSPTFYNTVYPDLVADVVIYGDIHFPYHIHFDEEHFSTYFSRLEDPNLQSFAEFHQRNKKIIDFLSGRQVYNTGSVGQPFGNTLASYLVLEGNLHSRTRSDFQVTFVPVAYDKQAAAQIALSSNMADKNAYSEEILTGVFRGHTPKSKIVDCL